MLALLSRKILPRLALAAALALACDSPTASLDRVRTAVFIDGVILTAAVDASRGAIVFTLRNPTATPRNIPFGGCDVSLYLYDTQGGELRYGPPSDFACRDFIDGVTVPPHGAAEYTRIVARPEDLAGAASGTRNRAFLVHIRFGNFRFLPETERWLRATDGAGPHRV